MKNISSELFIKSPAALICRTENTFTVKPAGDLSVSALTAVQKEKRSTATCCSVLMDWQFLHQLFSTITTYTSIPADLHGLLEVHTGLRGK